MIITIIFENAWTCILNKHDLNVLNMPKFWIWQGSQYTTVTQGPKYATIWPEMSELDVNMPNDLTISDRVFNVSYNVYSVKSLFKYWEIGLFRTLSNF